jgi:putative CocE/NonD family hydrolase
MKRIYKILFIIFIVSNLFYLTADASICAQIKMAPQEEKRIPISQALQDIISKENVEAAIQHYYNLKKNEPQKYDFSENQLNTLGYRLLQSGRIDDAITIFKLNVEVFPEAPNPYDSLAEAYLNKGDKERAVEYYNKALKINPTFDASINGLDKIYIIEHYEKKEYQIPMRDGIKLFTQVYMPKDNSIKYPILIFRTPYRVAPYGEEEINYRNVLGPTIDFTKEGYIFVYQDVRGKFMSEGEYVDMRPYKPIKKGPSDIDESSDTYDTIDWLVKNIPNNNGRAGIYGTSYPGFYSVMALIDAHPALVAASPQAPIADWFIDDDFHRNGAFYYLQAVNFLSIAGVPRPGLTKVWPPSLLDYPEPDLYDFLLDIGPVSNINAKYFKGKIPFWNQMLKHGTYDEFWKARNTLPHLNNIKTAVMTVGGWFDAEDLYGPLKSYATIEKNNPNIKNTLVVGPWYHGGWGYAKSEKLGDILVYSGSAAKYFQENIELPFFNYYLKDKGELKLPEAFIYNTGSNTWMSYDKWPPENISEKELYLQANHKLSFEKPTETGEEAFDEYISDPSKPVPHMGTTISGWSYDFMHCDQRYASTRPDVLAFETDTLKEDVTIAGPLLAELYVSTTGTDADWVVKLIDVYPDSSPNPTPNPTNVVMGGYQMLVRGEIMRGKFRNSFEKPEPFVPNKITKVKFELQDICHTFLKGHKIMVQIQSTWFPLFDRNPQKFVDIYNAKEADFQKATHKVYRSAEYSSHIKVKILK